MAVGIFWVVTPPSTMAGPGQDPAQGADRHLEPLALGQERGGVGPVDAGASPILEVQEFIARRPARATVRRALAASCAALLAACSAGRPAPPASTARPPAPLAAAPSADWSVAWAGGSSIAAGQRLAAIAVGKTGWILSREEATDRLSLTRVDMGSGASASADIGLKANALTGGGLAVDGDGTVWVDSGSEFERMTPSLTVLSHHPLPNPSADVVSAAGPGAGAGEAALWDSGRRVIAFVRNGDHRLYGLDPAAGIYSVIADLPLTTSYVSRLARESNGSIVVTGAVSGVTVFRPVAAIVTIDGVAAMIHSTVLAVCATPTAVEVLDAGGDVSDLGSASAPQPLVSGPPSNVPFACDGLGNAFATVTANGTTTVSRVTVDGTIASDRLPLEPLPSVTGFGGAQSVPWADPRLAAVLPDGSGGAWLLSALGETVAPVGATPYPSLLHVSF
ncbi:MAG TPA: hypothetical protein VFW92_00275 [Candidatus Limnocylindrales bacterium]|nr:hypothetical protein [Candidatus Limnocylindrales bacterium]